MALKAVPEAEMKLTECFALNLHLLQCQLNCFQNVLSFRLPEDKMATRGNRKQPETGNDVFFVAQREKAFENIFFVLCHLQVSKRKKAFTGQTFRPIPQVCLNSTASASQRWFAYSRLKTRILLSVTIAQAICH